MHRGLHSTRELHPETPAFLPPTQESTARTRMPNVGIVNTLTLSIFFLCFRRRPRSMRSTLMKRRRIGSTRRKVYLTSVRSSEPSKDAMAGNMKNKIHMRNSERSIKWLSPDNVSIASCKTVLLSMQLAQSCVNSLWPSDIKYCITDVGQHWPGTLAQVKQLLILGTIPEFDVAMILILRRLARLFACNAVAAVLC